MTWGGIDSAKSKAPVLPGLFYACTFDSRKPGHRRSDARRIALLPNANLTAGLGECGVNMRLSDCHNFHDFRRLAQRRLARPDL